MATFSAPIAKKAIKVAQDMGLTVTGVEVLPDGTVRVTTGADTAAPGEAELNSWIRKKNAKG